MPDNEWPVDPKVLAEAFKIIDSHPLKADTIILRREDAIAAGIPVDDSDSEVVIRRKNESVARALTYEEFCTFLGDPDAIETR